MFKAFGASDVGLEFCFVSVDEKRWGFFLPNVLKSPDMDYRESDRWALCGLLLQHTSGLGSRSTCKAFCSHHGGTRCAEGVSSWEELPFDDNGNLLGDTR